MTPKAQAGWNEFDLETIEYERTAKPAPAAPAPCYMHMPEERENERLVWYWRRVNGDAPCPVKFIDQPGGQILIRITRPVVGECRLPAIMAKAAIDFSRLSGVDIQTAAFRAHCQCFFMTGTDWSWWQGWDERWSDHGVKISTDGGATWCEADFNGWMIMQRDIRMAIQGWLAGQAPCPDVLAIVEAACSKFRQAEKAAWLSPEDIAALEAVGGKVWKANGNYRLYFNYLLKDQDKNAKAYIDVKSRERRVYGSAAGLRDRLQAELERRYEIAMNRTAGPEDVARFDKLKAEVSEGRRYGYMCARAAADPGAAFKSWY